MIIFFAPGGRVGNLLFQLHFIQSIRRPNEWILATQLRNIHRSLQGLRRVVNLENRLLVNLIDHLIFPMIYHGLVKTRIIGSYIEGPDQIITHRHGILPFTLVMGYFQDARRYNVLSQPLRLQPKFYARPRVLLHRAEHRTPLFLHIRRTDYQDYLIGGKPAVLPYGYYRRALKSLPRDLESYHVFVVGDDPEWNRTNFSWLPHKTFSDLLPLEDLALMSLCEGGIISNSSFAWWGARWCSHRQPIIAPKYWIGWPIQKWYPAGIQTEGFEYIDVQ